MALTRLDFTSTGSEVLHTVAFDLGYLREEYVYVYLDSDDYKTQLSYTWVSSTQIQLTTPVAAGLVYHIRRVVPRNNTINDYEDGAILKKKNLNDSFIQSIMILQEISDGYANPDGTYEVDGDIAVDGDVSMTGDLDMLGGTIKNIATAIHAQDATNKQYVDTKDAVLVEEERSISEESYVHIAGDTMSGVLNVLDSTFPNSAVPRTTIVSALDTMQRNLLDLLGVQTNVLDFGFIDVTPSEVEDYGLITDTATAIDDYGKIILW